MFHFLTVIIVVCFIIIICASALHGCFWLHKLHNKHKKGGNKTKKGGKASKMSSPTAAEETRKPVKKKVFLPTDEDEELFLTPRTDG